MAKLEELIDGADPAWPIVEEWLRNASNRSEALLPKEPDRADALVEMQVTLQSTMGAIIYETGGLLIDSGWLRILGSGHPRLPRSLTQWNKTLAVMTPGRVPPYILVADDVMGGFYAINSGGLGMAQGHIFYFAPDRLEWEDLGRGYTDFIHWCLFGDLDAYYESLRWPGWESDLKTLDGDQAFSIYPPLWTLGSPIGERSRKATPLAEIYDLYLGNDA